MNGGFTRALLMQIKRARRRPASDATGEFLFGEFR
jgi:hypothetical protein